MRRQCIQNIERKVKVRFPSPRAKQEEAMPHISLFFAPSLSLSISLRFNATNNNDDDDDDNGNCVDEVENVKKTTRRKTKRRRKTDD